jgi:hypothetical protein
MVHQVSKLTLHSFSLENSNRQEKPTLLALHVVDHFMDNPRSVFLVASWLNSVANINNPRRLRGEPPVYVTNLGMALNSSSLHVVMVDRHHLRAIT